MLKNLNWTELELRAFDFAKEAHKGQKRKSGGDFIEHPILVATFLKEAGFDKLCAGLNQVVLLEQVVALGDGLFVGFFNFSLVCSVCLLFCQNYCTMLRISEV